jgi:hypothetical protein
MDEQLTGPGSGEAAAPEESGLAERLIREEFGAPTSVFAETAPVPVVAAATAEAAVPEAAHGSIHEEFAEPVRPSPLRSHRTGMLAGLGVVGALLAVLVLLSPGSGQPRLPVQSVHDVSPITASGPKTAAATVLPAALPSTTSSTTTPTTQPRRSETVPTTVTYVVTPGTSTPAPAPAPASPPTTGAPAPPPTTAPPPPTTTPTTSPPTTTPTTHCVLGILCN